MKSLFYFILWTTRVGDPCFRTKSFALDEAFVSHRISIYKNFSFAFEREREEKERGEREREIGEREGRKRVSE